MDLDLQVAQAIARARLLERAAHDSGPWTVRIGSIEYETVRVRTPSGVHFLIFVDQTPDGDVAWLMLRGEEQSSWDLTGQLPDGAFTLQWKISAPQESTPVSA